MPLSSSAVNESRADPFKHEIGDQSSRILGSQTFSRTPRLRELFSFLADRSAVEGDGHGNLKEFMIAESVFGRGSDFDPAIDSVVRCEMRRLRLRLDRYYQTEGATDTIFVSIPRGTNLPRWQRRRVADFLDLSGTTQSHYRLCRRLQVTRQCSVYEAECVNSSRKVTIRIPSREVCDDEIRRSRLWADWKMAAHVDHPSIERVLALEERVSGPLLISAQSGWPSLAQIMGEATLTADEVAAITRQLAEAVAATHAAGLLHGALTIDSITIARTPETGIRVRIAPPGMASLIDNEEVQWQNWDLPLPNGVWTLQCDVWMIGRILRSLIAATGEIVETLYSVSERCMEISNEGRLETAREVAEALKAQAPEANTAPTLPPTTLKEFVIDRARSLFARMRLPTTDTDLVSGPTITKPASEQVTFLAPEIWRAR